MTSAQNGPKTAIINIFDKYIGAVLRREEDPKRWKRIALLFECHCIYPESTNCGRYFFKSPAGDGTAI